MVKQTALVFGDDGNSRCSWCVGDNEYMRYHDAEWGVPVVDDLLIYEKICLEGFQSGLSWLTILRKRPSFRTAFKNFEPEIVANFTAKDIERLMKDADIVRHRGKIEASIQNAKMTLQLQHQIGSLARFVWGFCPENRQKLTLNAPRSPSDIRSQSPESEAMSMALRKLGFKFVGATTMYAAMQSLGVVNDHYLGCAQRKKCEAARVKVLSEMLA